MEPDTPEPENLGDWVAAIARQLAAVGIETARLDARALVGAVAGLASQAVPCAAARKLSDAEKARLLPMVERRTAREPISRILGCREFWSLDFALSPATLDPRPDSETLVSAVLDAVGREGRAAPHHLLDLGTGSGCLLLALLSELPQACGLGVDRASLAVMTARANARHLGLGARASFLVASWGGPLADGAFDIIVANPPYIASARLAQLAPELAYDPVAALDGGADGLMAYRALIPDVARLLAPGGIAALEIGEDQAVAVARLLAQAGLDALPVIADLGGNPRVLVARRKLTSAIDSNSYVRC